MFGNHIVFPFNHFTAKEIKPHGWLKRQLQIQAEGLAGNLDKMWPDVRDSKWIGGDREGWESTLLAGRFYSYGLFVG